MLTYLYDALPTQFTGKQRDTETASFPGGSDGLDDFSARYNSSSLGRFISVDPANFGAVDESPQTWNMYSYVANNPLNATDPNGLDCIYINNDTGQYEGFNRGDCDNSTEEKANTGHYVNGTVDTITTTTGDANGVVTGYSGTGSKSGTLISGTFASPSSSGPSDELNANAIAIFSEVYRRDPVGTAAKIYGLGAIIGATGGAACYYLCPETATVALAGETGTDLIESTSTLNKIIGDSQRELLKEFFKTGRRPGGLSDRSLQIYKTIAQRAIAAGKDQLGVQASRLQMIVNALK